MIGNVLFDSLTNGYIMGSTIANIFAQMQIIHIELLKGRIPIGRVIYQKNNGNLF